MKSMASRELGCCKGEFIALCLIVLMSPYRFLCSLPACDTHCKLSGHGHAGCICTSLPRRPQARWLPALLPGADARSASCQIPRCKHSTHPQPGPQGGQSQPSPAPGTAPALALLRVICIAKRKKEMGEKC